MKAYTVHVVLDGKLIVRIPLAGEPEYGKGIDQFNVAQAVYAVIQQVGRASLGPLIERTGGEGVIHTATGMMLTATTDDPATLTEGAR